VASTQEDKDMIDKLVMDSVGSFAEMDHFVVSKIRKDLISVRENFMQDFEQLDAVLGKREAGNEVQLEARIIETL